MKVGSLFTGIGGFDYGLERAGMEVQWQVEVNDKCREVLRRAWEYTQLHEDVKDVGAHNVYGVDLICGGFPCQDVSKARYQKAGKGDGLDGGRTGLFWEFLRIVGEIEPKWVVLENVPGLLSSNGGRDMGTILGALADSGYGWAYRVLNSRCFGVPNERRRVFIVGCSGGRTERAGEVLFGGDEERSAHDREQAGRGTLPMLVGWDGGLSFERLRQCVVRKGRLRKLIPVEQERLQGFPDGWTAGHAMTTRYRMLGNAVTVPVAQWLGRRVLQVSRRPTP